MQSSKKKRLELMNMICRICAKEVANSVSIFGDEGKKQDIVKKIHACLPIVIDENDTYPKKICLPCLTKLDSFWDMLVLCKEAQRKIEKKLHLLRNSGNSDEKKTAPIAEDTPVEKSDNFNEDANCGVCEKFVGSEDEGVGCEGACGRWFHCECVNMTLDHYLHLVETPEAIWQCNDCRKPVPAPFSNYVAPSIEVRLRNLSESCPVTYGDTAVICLAPDAAPAPPTAPTTLNRDGQMLPPGVVVESAMPPVTYLAPATAPATASIAAPPTAEEVFPQALIQVPLNPGAEQPMVYQTSAALPTVPVPRRRVPPVPVPKPMASAPPTNSTPRVKSLKRQNGETPSGPEAKNLCRYCNKYFTDDIIHHHVSLHHKMSFNSCVECGKNFRSEEAMEKHRCEDKKGSATIDLDPEDDDTIIL